MNTDITNIYSQLNKLKTDVDSLIRENLLLKQSNADLINEVINFKTDIQNQVSNTALPLINATIDASKPELRNYIRMIVKEELRLHNIG